MNIPFILSIGAVLLAPLLYATKSKKLNHILDGLTYTTIVILVCFEILLHALEEGGLLVLAFLALGFFLPSFLEKSFYKINKKTHFLFLLLVILGLSLHSFLDGVSLSQSNSHKEEHGSSMMFAILAHRLPVSLLIWRLCISQRDMLLAVFALTVLLITTAAGFMVSDNFLLGIDEKTRAFIQSLVLGSLFHAIIHNPEHDHTGPIYKGIGSIMGLGAIIVYYIAFSPLSKILDSFVKVCLISAPFVLLGYIFSVLIDLIFPNSYFHWLKRGGALSQSARGVAAGLPTSACSWHLNSRGVLPLYKTLIHKGTPIAAGTAFLIATLELDIAAIMISLPLLGTELTIVRIVAATVIALLIGWFIGKFFKYQDHTTHDHERIKPKLTVSEKIKKSARFGLIEMVDHTAPWLILGIFIAAIVDQYFDKTLMANVASPYSVILFATLGLPMYVCASGATPLVASLLAGGVSPGAAIAFLITGPATNFSTFGFLKNMHGYRFAIFFSVVMIIASVTIGILINWFFLGCTFNSVIENHHSNRYEQISLFLLTILIGYSLIRRGSRDFLKELVNPIHSRESHNHDH